MDGMEGGAHCVGDFDGDGKIQLPCRRKEE